MLTSFYCGAWLKRGRWGRHQRYNDNTSTPVMQHATIPLSKYILGAGLRNGILAPAARVAGKVLVFLPRLVLGGWCAERYLRKVQ